MEANFENLKPSPPNSPRAIEAQLQVWIARLDLEAAPFRIGCNDLMPIVRKWSEPMEDFEASLEHIAFYIRSDGSQGLNKHKAWMLKQLQAGYYPAPAGFVSWQEQQAENKIRDREARAAKHRALRLRDMEAGFQLWLEELSPAERETIVRKRAPADSLDYIPAPMAMHLLRSHYGEIHNLYEFADLFAKQRTD